MLLALFLPMVALSNSKAYNSLQKNQAERVYVYADYST